MLSPLFLVSSSSPPPPPHSEINIVREGHASEVCRVIHSGDDNFQQCKNLLNIEYPNLLVAQAKLLKERTEDYLKYVRRYFDP
jgi:hypothetical protein